MAKRKDAGSAFAVFGIRGTIRRKDSGEGAEYVFDPSEPIPPLSAKPPRMNLRWLRGTEFGRRLRESRKLLGRAKLEEINDFVPKAKFLYAADPNPLQPTLDAEFVRSLSKWLALTEALCVTWVGLDSIADSAREARGLLAADARARNFNAWVREQGRVPHGKRLPETDLMLDLDETLHALADADRHQLIRIFLAEFLRVELTQKQVRERLRDAARRAERRQRLR